MTNLKYKLFFTLVSLLIYEVIVLTLLSSFRFFVTNSSLNIITTKYIGDVIFIVLGFSFGKFSIDYVKREATLSAFYLKFTTYFLKKIVLIVIFSLPILFIMSALGLFYIVANSVAPISFFLFSMLIIIPILTFLLFIPAESSVKTIKIATPVLIFFIVLIECIFLFFPNLIVNNFISTPPIKIETDMKKESQKEADRMNDCNLRAYSAEAEYIKINGIKKADGTIFISDDVRNKAAKASSDVWKSCPVTNNSTFKGF